MQEMQELILLLSHPFFSAEEAVELLEKESYQARAANNCSGPLCFKEDLSCRFLIALKNGTRITVEEKFRLENILRGKGFAIEGQAEF